MPLSEFIQFFTNVMLVQDFKSFLLACQNVCLIKKKEDNTYFIMLGQASLKEMMEQQMGSDNGGEKKQNYVQKVQ